MSQSKEKILFSNGQLEQLIEKAISKVEGRDENDVCKYLPGETGGYVHHFTLKKMKSEKPEKLKKMIQEYILNPSHPIRVEPKRRAARGSRKKKEQFTFSKNDLERMLEIARTVGDEDMINKLSPKKSLTSYQNELISGIRAAVRGERSIEELASIWDSFCRAVSYHKEMRQQFREMKLS